MYVYNYLIWFTDEDIFFVPTHRMPLYQIIMKLDFYFFDKNEEFKLNERGRFVTFTSKFVYNLTKYF